jgi:hypothetical protein
MYFCEKFGTDGRNRLLITRLRQKDEKDYGYGTS